MGVSASSPLIGTLSTLVKVRGVKLSEHVLKTFLQEIKKEAPWFETSGSFDRQTWGKLGTELKLKREQGRLRVGIYPIWKIIDACFEDEKCLDVLRDGQLALEEHRDSLSETEEGKDEKRENKEKQSSSRTEKERKEEVLGLNSLGPRRLGEDKRLYPSLAEFKQQEAVKEAVKEENKNQLTLVSNFQKLEMNRTSSTSSSDEEEEEGAPPPSWRKQEPKKREVNPPLRRVTKNREVMPPFWEATEKGGVIPLSQEAAEIRPSAPPGGQNLLSFCTAKSRRKIALAFPVFEDANQQRYHEPISLEHIKSLVEAVKTYGVNATYTQALVERLNSLAMTPSDWSGLVKACLGMGQYLDWKSLYHEGCVSQARENALQGQPVWNYDMLAGQGQWIANQIAYPPMVYQQINNIAIRAWKHLPNRGEVSGNLTKIIQGPTEPFADFAARLMDAGAKVFGDADTAMPLIEQLIFEQCTKECRAAILPWKGKGIDAWMKACREIGGPLTNN
ncbi:igE-binding protein-like [Fukomys damarensis]|uniref:igE-binding protein-like n=1 Tax=Fukomys damarensis TaxID=885580 RepID=UPI0005402000|nr:igE-binding protein-like [Fukomys damarensis]